MENMAEKFNDVQFLLSGKSTLSQILWSITGRYQRSLESVVVEYEAFSGYSHTQAAKSAACRPSLRGVGNRKVKQRSKDKSI